MADGELETFIESLSDEGKRADTRALIALFEDVVGEPASLSGGIIGFGRYHYRYASGREGDAARLGFSPRKNEFTLYLMEGGDSPEIEVLRARLGKHKPGKACLYIKRLSDVDMVVLADILRTALIAMDEKYPRGAAA